MNATDTTTNDIRATYTVPEGNIEPLRERVAVLAKRAARIGVGAIVMDVQFSHTERYEARDAQGRVIYDGELVQQLGVERKPVMLTRDWYTVTIEGEAPRFNGWLLAGTLYAEDGGVLIRAVPGVEMPVEMRDPAKAYDCDHCRRAVRRYVTHVVREEATGRFLRVGSSCIKDFLGHQDPHALARWAEALGAFAAELGGVTEPGWGGGRNEDRWTLDGFIAQTQAVARRIGWVSRTTARANGDTGEGPTEATVDHVLNLLTPPSSFATREAVAYWQAQRAKFTVEDADRAYAEAAIAWAEGEWLARPEDALNDYEHNVAVALRSGSVSRRTAGVVASVTSAYYRHIAAQERTARDAERKATAQPVPVSDKRMTVEGRIVKIDLKENDFGTRIVMTVETDAGWRVWGTMPRQLEDAARGSDFRMSTWEHVQKLEGARVRFDAKVERSDRDATFGFYQRPTKAVVVE